MIKKKIITSLLIIFFSLMINSLCFATSTGVITGETVKLRSKPSLESSLVTLLSVDNKVEVIEKDGDWYKVKYKEDTGYVYKDYIKVDEKVEEVNTNTTEENSNENNITEENNNQPESTNPDNTENNNNSNESGDTNNSENTNNDVSDEDFTIPSEKLIKEDSDIKILPLINSSTIDNLKKNTKVTVTEIKNGWAYINSEQISGWIRCEKLNSEVSTSEENKEEAPKPEENETTANVNENTQTAEVKETKGYVSASSVNVRKEPNTSSEVVTSIAMNTEVTIVSEEDGWAKVKVNGKEGYILKKYLSDKKTETTSRHIEERTEKNKETETTTETENNTQTTTNVDNSNSSNNSNSSGTEIVNYAKSYLGVKYVYGGASPSGFDCSGFTMYVYKKYGYTLSHSATAQSKVGKEVSRANLQPGDLVIFRDSSNKAIGHVGIYIGGNQFIHASSPGDVVKITSLSSSYYNTRYVTARRLI